MLLLFELVRNLWGLFILLSSFTSKTVEAEDLTPETWFSSSFLFFFFFFPLDFKFESLFEVVEPIVRPDDVLEYR